MWIGIQPLRSWAPGNPRQSGTESAEIRGHEFPCRISAPVGIRSHLSKSAGNGYVSSFARIFAINDIRADHVNVVNVPGFPGLQSQEHTLRATVSAGLRLIFAELMNHLRHHFAAPGRRILKQGWRSNGPNKTTAKFVPDLV